MESARFQGTGCVLATGAQLSSGCPVRLAFLVDGASFAQQRKFHQLARNTAFVPGGACARGLRVWGYGLGFSCAWRSWWTAPASCRSAGSTSSHATPPSCQLGLAPGGLMV